MPAGVGLREPPGIRMPGLPGLSKFLFSVAFPRGVTTLHKRRGYYQIFAKRMKRISPAITCGNPFRFEQICLIVTAKNKMGRISGLQENNPLILLIPVLDQPPPLTAPAVNPATINFWPIV